MVVNEPAGTSNNNLDAPDNASIHVQQQQHITSYKDSNIMVNSQRQQQSQNDITVNGLHSSNNNGNDLSTIINSNHQQFLNQIQNESNYINHKVSNYDVAYGTSGLAMPNEIQLRSQQAPPIPPPPMQLQPQASLMTTNATVSHQVVNSMPGEPVYGINRSGMIAFVAQQPEMLAHHEVNGTDVMWRDPELEEVISFLNSPDPMVRANSIGYLQHLSYADDIIKQKTRQLGGIPLLINLLNGDMLEVKRNVCGALRNLSYGRKNDDNKRAIRDASGIQSLVRTLIDNPDNEIRELATSVLWNLSSCEDVKWTIIDDALGPLISVILVPYTSWFRANINSTQQFLPTVNETHWSTVYRNVTGVLRNISSAGAHARKQLRDFDGLIESLFFIINSSISRNDVENKLVENCVCILRNLSYRCQETQDPDYDKHYYNGNYSQSDSATNSMQNSPSSPSSSANLTSSLMGQVGSRVSNNFGCFRFAKRARSKSKTKSESLSTSNQSKDQTHNSSTQQSATLLPPHHPNNLQMNGQTTTLVRTSTQIDGVTNSNATLPRSGISNITNTNDQQPGSGKYLLWQPEVVKPYLALLSGCSNPETLEAAAGAIQNLAACYWQPSIEIRAAFRKERGLPVLVELLRMDRDRVVCVVATALRNLAIEQKSKELIGKYAMPDLVNKLTTTTNDQECPSSDDTIAAVLATLHEVISNNVEFARSLYEAGGLNKLTFIVRNKTKYSARVQRFAAQVLLDMWKFTELREIYKKGGWKDSHFIVRPQIATKNSSYSVNSNTIERPIASQQADRSSSTRNLRAVSATSVPQTMIQQTPDMFNSANNNNQSSDPYPAYGSVQMTTLNGQLNNPNALYAQVDRQRKRNDMTQQLQQQQQQSNMTSDPSSNHKLLCRAKLCNLESDTQIVKLDESEIIRRVSSGGGGSTRTKRSAPPYPRQPESIQLNIWNELELILRAAYQETRQHNTRRNDRLNRRDDLRALHHSLDNNQNETPRPQELNQLHTGQPREGDSASSSVVGANEHQASQTPPPPAIKVIETAVFIDQALDSKFAGLSNGLVELNKLVLTIMNQVQYLFEYSSLQVAIKLKLVLIEHLRESERLVGLTAPSSERGDIDAYLGNFCTWQQSRLEREKRLWWDHAILLSGLDLYKATPGKNHSGVLGLAWVGGMCKGNYSCTINEASNFESAFVIAHEIGHSLGIMHDGQKNKCDPNQFIMSERTGAGKVHWSRCSNSYLNESIARGQLKCLDSEQNNQIDSLYDLAKLRSPGQVYTINEQCKLAFGSNYSSFVTHQAPFNAVCRELWCVAGTWAKAAHPALEGSSCTGGPVTEHPHHQDLMCREGKCLRAALAN